MSHGETLTGPVVEFRGVSFGYGATPVLTDATFAIDACDLVSVVGPNGGGKTTLLKLILGLLEPVAGEVRVFGGAAAAARRRIGYVPQQLHYDPRFPVTVLDVALMGRLGRTGLGWHSRADRRAARKALAQVDVADLAPRQFAELSGGQRQRVLIARALAGEPELLLLDEPLANVDAAAEQRLRAVLLSLNERMAVVLVSHDLGFVSEFVRRVVCVNRTVAVHPTSEITGEVIRDVYGADLRMVRHDHRCAEGGHQHG